MRDRNDPAKSSNSKKYIVCHYWYFNHGFKYQKSACNGFYDLLMLRLNTGDIIIKSTDYRFIIDNSTNSDAIILSQNPALPNHGYI